MNSRAVADSGRKISARRDSLLIIVVAVIAAVVCAKFNLSETLLNLTRPFERLQLDELPAVVLVIAISLVWFASRRYFEATRQLRLRVAAEERLRETLAENQRLAQQSLDVQEHERKALARDLHDELGQYLNVIKLDAVSIREALPDHRAAGEVARRMIANIDRVSAVVRGLIRRLRPVGFDDLGVAAALEHCVNEWRSRLPLATIGLSLTGDVEALDETRGLALYRLVQESLTNIARHSKATEAEIQVTVSGTAQLGQCLEIIVTDNGCGADLTAPQSGLGLVGMRERVSVLGGSITLASEPGAGFRIVCLLPLSGAP